MYVICTYDVNEKRCDKLKKLLRQYLFHVQKSVFEGELTPHQMKELQEKIKKIILSEDSVQFYYCYNNKQIYKDELGNDSRDLNIIEERRTQ